MKKEEIKDLVQLVRQANGVLTLAFIPQSTIFSAQELYNLYYSGWSRIEIGSKYVCGSSESIEITDENVDSIVDKIHAIMADDVGDYINKALTNLGMDDTQVKYFKSEGEEENLKKFQDEVLKLKEESIIRKEKANERNDVTYGAVVCINAGTCK